MTEFVVGENGVLSWSPPVPPNGVILYYNDIISSGQLVTRVEELDVLTIDVSNHGEINMDYNVTVRANRGVFQFYSTPNYQASLPHGSQSTLLWCFNLCLRTIHNKREAVYYASSL